MKTKTIKTPSVTDGKNKKKAQVKTELKSVINLNLNIKHRKTRKTRNTPRSEIGITLQGLVLRSLEVLWSATLKVYFQDGLPQNLLRHTARL